MQALQHNFLLRGYFNKRGYYDAGQLSKNLISRLPSQAPSKEFDIDSAKLFTAPDSAKLKDKKVLNDAGQYLQDNHFGLAVIASRVTKGDSSKDRILTEARANVVRDYMVQNFKLNDTRVKTIGLGKSTKPDSSNTVQILIYAVSPSSSQARNQSSPSNE